MIPHSAVLTPFFNTKQKSESAELFEQHAAGDIPNPMPGHMSSSERIKLGPLVPQATSGDSDSENSDCEDGGKLP